MSSAPVAKPPNYQFYFMALNVTHNTTASSLVTTAGNSSYPSLNITKGKIVQIMPIFPSGSNQLVYVQLKFNQQIFFPTISQNGFINLNDTPNLLLAFTQDLQNGGVIDIQGYNTDTTNDHLISFGFVVQVD